MWTISNFHARGRRRHRDVLRVTVGLGLLCCQPSRGQVAPDSPRPAAAAPETRPEPAPAARDSGPPDRPIELTAVRIHRPDSGLIRLAGPSTPQAARDLLVIDVQTRDTLPSVPRTGSVALVVNGRLLPGTWALLPNRLIAFVTDRHAFQDTNSVAAVWIGNEENTRSRNPLRISSSAIEP